MIPVSKWEWFGNHGHFICGRWCRFHLCTLVGKYLVSTVGELVHPSDSGSSEFMEDQYLEKNPLGANIGAGDGKFETLVFLAGKRCDSKECGCGMPELANRGELDGVRCKTRKEARENHMEYCRKYANMKDAC